MAPAVGNHAPQLPIPGGGLLMPQGKLLWASVQKNSVASFFVAPDIFLTAERHDLIDVAKTKKNYDTNIVTLLKFCVDFCVDETKQKIVIDCHSSVHIKLDSSQAAQLVLHFFHDLCNVAMIFVPRKAILIIFTYKAYK